MGFQGTMRAPRDSKGLRETPRDYEDYEDSNGLSGTPRTARDSQGLQGQQGTLRDS